MSSGNSSEDPAFDDLLLAVKHGLEAIEHSNDFTTVDPNKVWEMTVVRQKKVHLSIKSWNADLLSKLRENFDIPGYTANFRSPNGCHLVITKK